MANNCYSFQPVTQAFDKHKALLSNKDYDSIFEILCLIVSTYGYVDLLTRQISPWNC